MKIHWSQTQKDLLDLAKEKGHLEMKDIELAYSSVNAKRDNLKRFLLAGVLKRTDNPNKFEYVSPAEHENGL